jgi:hypothetical protein
VHNCAVINGKIEVDGLATHCSSNLSSGWSLDCTEIRVIKRTTIHLRLHTVYIQAEFPQFLIQHVHLLFYSLKHVLPPNLN